MNMISLIALLSFESIFPTVLIVIGQIVVAIIAAYSVMKVAQLKTHINSRMDDLLKLTSDSAFAKGKLQGETNKKKIK